MTMLQLRKGIDDRERGREGGRERDECEEGSCETV